MLKQKSKSSKKRRIVIWAVSIGTALTIFSLFLVYESYVSNRAREKNLIKRNVERIVNKPVSDDPGKITQFELIIEKIGVMIPVIPNVAGDSQEMYNQALANGVAHYKGTALPNSGSNILIFGHSSSILGMGKYDKIFAKLNNLVLNDEITINYNQKEYQYLVTEKKIISATDLSVIEPTMKEQLTLMTCWPIGTDQKRLVVIAKPVK